MSASYGIESICRFVYTEMVFLLASDVLKGDFQK